MFYHKCLTKQIQARASRAQFLDFGRYEALCISEVLSEAALDFARGCPWHKYEETRVTRGL